MKILLAPFLLAVSLPAFAEVDPKIHKLCIEAKDYSGCVRSMKGETSTETTVNQIHRQGANLTEGNSCPAGHWYSGGGYCHRVICIKSGLFGYGNDPQLAGKGIKRRGGAEIHWDPRSQPIRASFNANCPLGVPKIGYQSTCQSGISNLLKPTFGDSKVNGGIDSSAKYSNNGYQDNSVSKPKSPLCNGQRRGQPQCD